MYCKKINPHAEGTMGKISWNLKPISLCQRMIQMCLCKLELDAKG